MATTFEGTILRGESFDPVEGRVVVEDGTITAVEEAPTDSTDIVLPAFVNAHTHIGDSIAKEAGGGLSLDDLVAPPDGLKHRLLRAASREEKVEAMARSLRFMETSGTAAFMEFREGGVEGVEAIRDALADREIDPVIFGRESADAMRAADGFGASGARDSEFGDLCEACREEGKPFAIHAGERDPHDLTPAMDLDPAYLIHVVHPRDEHLDRIEAEELPVVVCPRSNLVTNVGVAPIRELTDRTTVALGTDNVMLNSPSMFREMEFTAKLADVSAETVLRMATRNGAEIAGKEYGLIEAGRPAKLLTMDGDSDNLTGAEDPVRAVVRRAGVADVKDVTL
ncbi:amidohydrolase family protein [Halolamina litorea]|uniref:Amidohydrolase family protein n=1 Tax=Halolamina litorea TaxID=1515593 RepID=A0ABD6BU25_9EURY|nr:amidohydrolase family protein [Halolamina litorea]